MKENDSGINVASETYNNESTNETASALDVKTLVNDLPDGASSASKTVVEDGEKVESMTFEILNQPSSMEDSYVEITSGEAANNAETVSTEAESVTAEASDHPEPEQEPEEEEELDRKVNSVEEKIEVIDLVVNENEDKDDDVDDSDIICETDKNDSVIFCGSSDNRRITRASLKKDSEYDDDEIVLLKEVEGTKKAAELLEESDFTDSDNDSSVVSVETEVTLDMDKNEAETIKQNGDTPSEDKSKNHSDTESDKLNESLKIDLRPSWQVKKTTFAKAKETTASI